MKNNEEKGVIGKVCDGFAESTRAGHEIGKDTNETMVDLGAGLRDKDRRKKPKEVGKSSTPNAKKMGKELSARKEGTIKEQAKAYAEDGKTLRGAANVLGSVGDFLTDTLLKH